MYFLNCGEAVYKLLEVEFYLNLCNILMSVLYGYNKFLGFTSSAGNVCKNTEFIQSSVNRLTLNYIII